MTQIYMKCRNYDANTLSIQIAFASDETKSQDPEAYGYLSYQPFSMFPDVTDNDELIKKLVHLGFMATKQQAIQESLVANTTCHSALLDMNNNSYIYNVDDSTGITNVDLVNVVNDASE